MSKRDKQGRVVMRESLGSRLSTTAQDVAYAAAQGIEASYGRDFRNRAIEVGKQIPVVKTILERKNKY